MLLRQLFQLNQARDPSSKAPRTADQNLLGQHRGTWPERVCNTSAQRSAALITCLAKKTPEIPHELVGGRKRRSGACKVAQADTVGVAAAQLRPDTAKRANTRHIARNSGKLPLQGTVLACCVLSTYHRDCQVVLQPASQ